MFTDGTTYYAKNCDTEAIDYQGTTLSTVLNNAISALTSGGMIRFRAGNYTITSPINVNNANIALIGEGRATKFQLSAGFSGNVFNATSAGVTYRDFMVDASNQQRASHSLASIAISAGADNATVSGLYLFNGEHAGIYTGANNTIITNNYVANMWDDGIISGVGSSFVTIAGNVIDTTTNHNGISLISAQNVTVSGNSISNTLYGIALENIGSGTCKFITATGNQIRAVVNYGFIIYAQSGGVDSGQYVTFTGNTITTPGTTGVHLDSGKYVTIASNVISNPTTNDGIYLSAVSKFVTVTGNTVQSPKLEGIDVVNGFTDGVFSGNIIQNPGQRGMFFAASVYNVTISGNEIYYPGAGAPRGIDVQGGKNIVINGNTIRILVAAGTGIRLGLSESITDFAVTGNQIIGSGTSGVTQITAAIYVTGSASYGTISSNVILGDAIAGIQLTNGPLNVTVIGNTVNIATTCIKEDGENSNSNFITSNSLSNCATKVSFVGNQTQVLGNKGYNPIGKVTNFIYSGGTGALDGNFISPIGTTPIIATSTTYTITTAPCRILILGVGTTISIDGGTAFTPVVGEMLYLYPRETINFGTVVPTVEVFFA